MPTINLVVGRAWKLRSHQFGSQHNICVIRKRIEIIFSAEEKKTNVENKNVGDYTENPRLNI